MILADVLPTVPEQLLGPYSALAGAIILILAGGRILWWFIQDLRTQRDLAQAGWREQTSATKAVADAVEERNRLESERMRVEEAEARGAARTKRPTRQGA